MKETLFWIRFCWEDRLKIRFFLEYRVYREQHCNLKSYGYRKVYWNWVNRLPHKSCVISVAPLRFEPVSSPLK